MIQVGVEASVFYYCGRCDMPKTRTNDTSSCPKFRAVDPELAHDWRWRGRILTWGHVASGDKTVIPAKRSVPELR